MPTDANGKTIDRLATKSINSPCKKGDLTYDPEVVVFDTGSVDPIFRRNLGHSLKACNTKKACLRFSDSYMDGTELSGPILGMELQLTSTASNKFKVTLNAGVVPRGDDPLNSGACDLPRPGCPVGIVGACFDATSAAEGVTPFTSGISGFAIAFERIGQLSRHLRGNLTLNAVALPGFGTPSETFLVSATESSPYFELQFVSISVRSLTGIAGDSTANLPRDVAAPQNPVVIDSGTSVIMLENNLFNFLVGKLVQLVSNKKYQPDFKKFLRSQLTAPVSCKDFHDKYAPYLVGVSIAFGFDSAGEPAEAYVNALDLFAFEDFTDSSGGVSFWVMSFDPHKDPDATNVLGMPFLVGRSTHRVNHPPSIHIKATPSATPSAEIKSCSAHVTARSTNVQVRIPRSRQ